MSPTPQTQPATTQNNGDAHEQLSKTIKTSITPSTERIVTERIEELKSINGKDSIDLSKFIRLALETYFIVNPNVGLNLFEDGKKTIHRVQTSLSEERARHQKANESWDNQNKENTEMMEANERLKSSLTKERDKYKIKADANGIELKDTILTFYGFVVDLCLLYKVDIVDGVATFIEPDDTGRGREVPVKFWDSARLRYTIDAPKLSILHAHITRIVNANKAAMDQQIDIFTHLKNTTSVFIGSIRNALDIRSLGTDDVYVHTSDIENKDDASGRHINSEYLNKTHPEFVKEITSKKELAESNFTDLNNLAKTICNALGLQWEHSKLRSFGGLAIEYGNKITELKEELDELKKRGLFSRIFNRGA